MNSGSNGALNMIVELGLRGFNPRLGRLVTTSIGLSFAFVLIALQVSLTAGFVATISGILDRADVDLWIVPIGTTAFDEPSSIDTTVRYAALRFDDVATIAPLLVGYAEWRSRSGSSSSVIVVGADVDDGPARPWNVTSGSVDELWRPHAVSVDDSYAAQLGISGLGSDAVIDGQKVSVAALTSGIRSFTTSPYVFTNLSHARALLGVPSGKASYLAVKLTDRSDVHVARARAALTLELPGVEIFTPREFRFKNLSKWLLDTGAGAALLIGALIGFAVGCVIITQTLLTNINEQLGQLATLRTMGASNGFLGSSIVCYVGVTLGLAIAIGSALFSVIWSVGQRFALPLAVSPGLGVGIVAVTVLMGVTASLVAIRKVLSIDPAVVFAR
jgi:putative ABC transport system permease protein